VHLARAELARYLELIAAALHEVSGRVGGLADVAEADAPLDGVAVAAAREPADPGSVAVDRLAAEQHHRPIGDGERGEPLPERLLLLLREGPAEQKKNGPPRKLVGFEVTGRGIARHGYPVLLHDERVGEVTSGTYAPFLQKNIGLCYLPTPRAVVGTELAIDIRERKVPARVVPTPFYKRADKTATPS